MVRFFHIISFQKIRVSYGLFAALSDKILIWCDSKDADLKKTFTGDFRHFFIRGLAAVLPTVATIAIIVWVFTLIQDYCGIYINNAAAHLTTILWVRLAHLSSEADISQARAMIFEFWHEKLFWVGFLLAIVGVYIFGRFLASFLGQPVWRVIERTLIRLPVIKQIYPSAKQVTDFLLVERKLEFSSVVAVEYPCKGIWSLGLATNPGIRTLHDALHEDLITVFIPSSPTPVTGYTITVGRDKVIDLPMSIDDALRFTISGGVIQPGHQVVEKELSEPKGLFRRKDSLQEDA